MAWTVGKCEPYNKHPNDMCINKIGQCTQNLLAILGLSSSIYLTGPIAIWSQGRRKYLESSLE